MNVSIIDPFQGDFPEVIEEFLEHGITKCIAFNRRGTLLAAGCMDGVCVIWDFETRGVAKELRDKDCGAIITSVSWSKCGRRLLASATDKSLTLWDVAQGEKIAQVTLQYPALHARLHPGSVNPSFCLACPISSAPILVDFNSGSMFVLPVSASAAGTDVAHNSRSKCADGTAPYTPAAASFNKRGDLIFVGNHKGDILIIDTETKRVQAIFQIPGAPVIRHIVFSKSGQYLLTNCNDRIIRVYENVLSQHNAARALEELVNASGDSTATENLKLVGSQCLTLIKEFQDAVTRVPWKTACFSGDSEWVVGGWASKGEHKIYIWDRLGQLVKILEGPKEGLADLAWHPVHPMVASVSMTGMVYIWAKDYTENWSAFAPDFKELEENEEYIEREDEFDMMPDTEKVRRAHVNEDEEVDIMTTEKISAFSDSDDSQEGLYFLPTIPLPDSPKQQDQSSGSPSKPENSTPSQSERSPLPGDAKAKTPEISVCQIPDSLEEECGSNGRIKRKRRLSEKGAEMQAEKGRKPVAKNGSATKQKSEIKTSFLSQNRFLASEDVLVDANFSRKSTSLEDAEDPVGEFEDEVPSSSKRGGKKIQQLKFVNSLPYPPDSSCSPSTSE
eukprot:Gb_30454 [translate_table: standard]